MKLKDCFIEKVKGYELHLEYITQVGCFGVS